MKCPICKGTMEKVKDIIEQDGVEFEALKCTSCGEELLDMAQLKSLASKYRSLRKAKDVTFAQWGNSIAVRIPRDIAEEFHIVSGKQGLLKKEKDGIKIVPV
ncbi:MAG TPA: hypothetical protein VJH88_04465 [Candidatus Nanoarchaeia archaeon]|nr:hypothetical protein [Candidatus Nanoarchaeia archaeon]